jgi:hypothetical protein
MILKKFDYNEFEGQPNSWALKDFYLNDKVNLLVRKNATGKSRTVDKISALSGMLIGYDISKLSVDKNPYTAVIEEDKSPLFMLCVKEKDRDANLYQTGMSQGMLVDHLNYENILHTLCAKSIRRNYNA